MRKVKIDLDQSQHVADILEFGNVIFVVDAPSSLHEAFATQNHVLGKITIEWFAKTPVTRWRDAMKNKKSGPRPRKKDHVGEGGRVFQEQGINPNAGKSKGHDLLESDSFTDGVGSAINSPSEAKRIDEERERSDRET